MRDEFGLNKWDPSVAARLGNIDGRVADQKRSCRTELDRSIEILAELKALVAHPGLPFAVAFRRQTGNAVTSRADHGRYRSHRRAPKFGVGSVRRTVLTVALLPCLQSLPMRLPWR